MGRKSKQNKPEDLDIEGFTICAVPVVAKTRKLKSTYTIEAADDLMSMHGTGELIRPGKDVLKEKLRPAKSKKILGKPLTKIDRQLIKDWDNKDFEKHEVRKGGLEDEIISILAKEMQDSTDKEIINTIKQQSTVTKSKFGLVYDSYTVLNEMKEIENGKKTNNI